MTPVLFIVAAITYRPSASASGPIRFDARVKQPLLSTCRQFGQHGPVNIIGGHITLILPDPRQRAASFHALATDGDRVIRSFAHAEDYLEAADDVAGGVAILHWAQPGAIGGRALLAAIAARGDLEALVVADQLSLAESRAILHTGARDLVPAPIETETLQEIVGNALCAWSDAELYNQSRRDARARLDRLTPREQDILAAMAEGLASKEIARRFDLSPRTVEVHRANIMRRSESRSFAELMRLTFLTETGFPARSPDHMRRNNIHFKGNDERSAHTTAMMTR